VSIDKTSPLYKTHNNLIDLLGTIVSLGESVLSFCSRTRVTYFKVQIKYDIRTDNSGSILFDKTWEEGNR